MAASFCKSNSIAAILSRVIVNPLKSLPSWYNTNIDQTIKGYADSIEELLSHTAWCYSFIFKGASDHDANPVDSAIVPIAWSIFKNKSAMTVFVLNPSGLKASHFCEDWWSVFVKNIVNRDRNLILNRDTLWNVLISKSLELEVECHEYYADFSDVN